MADKGSCTVTEQITGPVKKITFDWTAGTGGDAGLCTKTTTYTYSGAIVRFITDPDAAGDAPTALYDIVLNDDDSQDVLNGAGSNRSATATEQDTSVDVLGSSLGVVANSKLTLSISNAGDTKKGLVIVYIR